MKFCEKCGSYMRKTPKGWSCTRCGNKFEAEIVEVVQIKERTLPVEVVQESKADYQKVDERCPRCGNPTAFRRVSFVSGEHAGVRQERSMEVLTCTKCHHTWTKG